MVCMKISDMSGNDSATCELRVKQLAAKIAIKHYRFYYIYQY